VLLESKVKNSGRNEDEPQVEQVAFLHIWLEVGLVEAAEFSSTKS
jgi:hypothetical protein